ncbi:MAG TPA: chalcone isomerase family protein [Sideroxyarcus sp.]|nr:chalcone isomerase family protein [Sideroxyarcus sp.]
MKKILLLVCALLLSQGASAVQVGGVNLDSKIQLGKQELVLNGAGVRTKVVFDIYVAALYLGAKTTKAEAVLADAGSKRVALHLLYSMSSAKLMAAFKSAIEANHSEAELKAMDAALNKFYAIFNSIPDVNAGDVILLDYLPEAGTKVTVNGVDRGTVEGAEVNHALLRIWLGNKPVQDDLKKDLLHSW